jgi:hypothetical protein
MPCIPATVAAKGTWKRRHLLASVLVWTLRLYSLCVFEAGAAEVPALTRSERTISGLATGPARVMYCEGMTTHGSQPKRFCHSGKYANEHLSMQIDKMAMFCCWLFPETCKAWWLMCVPAPPPPPRFLSFIHSFCSQSYDRSVSSSKASSPQGAIWCFLFLCPVSSVCLRPSSSCLRLVQSFISVPLRGLG